MPDIRSSQHHRNKPQEPIDFVHIPIENLFKSYHEVGSLIGYLCR